MIKKRWQKQIARLAISASTWARTSARKAFAALRSAGGIIFASARARATPNDIRGLTVSSQGWKVSANSGCCSLHGGILRRYVKKNMDGMASLGSLGALNSNLQNPRQRGF